MKERNFQNLYFELKDKCDAMQRKLDKKEQELLEMQKKYRELLMKKEKKDTSNLFSFNNKNSNLRLTIKKNPIIKRIPIRFFLLTIMLVVLATYMFSAVQKEKQDGLYAEITKGTVFPKRTIASLADIFYHK